MKIKYGNITFEEWDKHPSTATYRKLGFGPNDSYCIIYLTNNYYGRITKDYDWLARNAGWSLDHRNFNDFELLKDIIKENYSIPNLNLIYDFNEIKQIIDNCLIQISRLQSFR